MSAWRRAGNKGGVGGVFTFAQVGSSASVWPHPPGPTLASVTVKDTKGFFKASDAVSSIVVR